MSPELKAKRLDALRWLVDAIEHDKPCTFAFVIHHHEENGPILFAKEQSGESLLAIRLMVELIEMICRFHHEEL